jgi:hypothetical protein
VRQSEELKKRFSGGHFEHGTSHRLYREGIDTKQRKTNRNNEMNFYTLNEDEYSERQGCERMTGIKKKHL